MRGLQLPLGAIALASGAICALASTRQHEWPSLNGADSLAGSHEVEGSSGRLRTHPSAKSTPQISPNCGGTSSLLGLNSSLLPVLSLTAQLVPLVCRADASGYDTMEPTPPPTASPLITLLPSSSNVNSYDNDDGTDTITGVFHRLDPQRAKLILVQVVFRHGARTPLSSRTELWRGQQWDVCGEAYQAAVVRLFSTAGVEDPVSKHDLRQRSVVLDGGCRKGELTLLGQAQARDLGRWLRTRYVAETGFLPPQHRAGDVEARTTNTSRTISTLRGVITGLYPDLPRLQHQQGQQQGQQLWQGREGPPGPGQQHGEGQAPDVRSGAAGLVHDPSMVPPVTTSGDLDEILYADSRACPHLSSLQALSREAGRVSVRSDPEYEWARGEVVRLLGLDTAAFDSDRWIFTDLHDVLTSLGAHGKQLPPGFQEQPRLRAAINRLATKEFGAEVAPSVRDSHGRTVLTLSMGRLLHMMVRNMQQAAAAGAAAAAAGVEGTAAAGGPGQPRLYLYSGHDSTIMPLLSALRVDMTEWPPYLSNLVLELWQLAPRAPGAAPRHVVRVLYNQQELPLPHCPPGFLPSLPTFEGEVVGPFLLSAQRHQELCTVRLEHTDSMPQPHARKQAKQRAQTSQQQKTE